MRLQLLPMLNLIPRVAELDTMQPEADQWPFKIIDEITQLSRWGDGGMEGQA